LNADTGKAHRNAFRADLTLTMFASKLGMYVNDGPNLCGNIEICLLGAPILQPVSDNFLILDDNAVIELLGKREPDTDKFSYGRIVVISGSESMPGAAALTANSAIKSGAGLVELLTTTVHSATLPEVISYKLKPNTDGTISDFNEDIIAERIEKADTVVIGPGIGNNESTINMLVKLYSTYKHKKYVIDADGLRGIAKLQSLSDNTIITPHIYEFSKLINNEPKVAKANLIKYAKEYAQKTNSILLVKSRPTVITNGNTTFLNTGGNPGMATAGSGDVLTGIIAGLSNQIQSPLLCTAVAAYLHSRSGDLYAEQNDPISLTASSLIDYLPQAINSVYTKKQSE
jgi:NAD(P)H-hydrate epimerase